MSTKAEQSMSMFGAMTLAAMAGATAALLLAPRKGSETREQIKNKLQQTKDMSRRKMMAARAKTQAGTDKLKGQASEVTTEAGDAVAEARSQVEDAAADSKTRNKRTPPVPPVL